MEQRYKAVPRFNGYKDFENYAKVLLDLRQFLLETDQLEDTLAAAKDLPPDAESLPPEAA